MKIGVRTVEEGRRWERDRNRDTQRQGRKAKQDPMHKQPRLGGILA